MRLRPVWWAALLLAAAAPAPSQQATLDPRRAQAARQDLQELLDLYEKSAESRAYSEGLRARSRFEASLIRERLENGDFQPGERIQLAVEGEPTLGEAFVVTEGPLLRLPLVGEVSLAGVLRSEVEEHLRTQIGRFVQNPRVRARSLIRISIMGGVLRPGFHAASSDVPVSDALMVAGGPVPGARVDEITIERAGRRIWSAELVQQSIIEGRTLDQLGVRTGDRIRVPQRGAGLFAAGGWIQVVSMFLSLPLTIYGLVNLF